MKISIIKLIHKVHFFFLYVFIYSILRNFHRMNNDGDPIIPFIHYLTISFGIWYLSVNLIILLLPRTEEGRRESWDRNDYLSIPVILASIFMICVLEYFMF